MLPTVLKYFLHADQSGSISQRMTPARLRGYKLHQFSTSSTPVIVPAAEPTAVVEGILVLGLDDTQRNAIYEVEGGLMHLVGVEVQVSQRQRAGAYEMQCARLVDTGTFVWKGSRDGLAPLSGVSWCVDGFLTGQFYRYIVQSQRREALDRMSQSGADQPSIDGRRGEGRSYL